MKSVSVILTTYNGVGKVEKTIKSILEQRGIGENFQLELIVVDDSSTDGTLDRINQFDLKFYSTDMNSGGPNKGRNIGLKNATGDYICIADHDDIWHENRIITLLPYLEKVPIVTSGYTLVDNAKNGTIKRITQSNSDHLFYERNKTFLTKLTKSLSGQNTYLGTIIFRKELKDIFFEELFGMVDFDWVLKLFHQQTSIEVCNSLYTRYVDSSNLSLNQLYRKKDFYYSLMSVENYFEQYPKEVRIAYKKIYGSRARYYYLINDMKLARFYFLRSRLNLKTFFYYLTTYFGSTWIKKKFNVFG